ncbi:H-2 class II histocompatibility antigen, A-U alpha chain-like [Archocentrus centrarchus]|uniref:H-2 class II histocompatibility antigen, A-U alpha chain-like n=1 Tax=Archocentrus centrarchus TaxID=63155 RepID=UPI0011E9E4C6|nr:H-2 class II histocompatibility antigen, A-U alpha chain-like [Archocentrus centrarchus]
MFLKIVVILSAAACIEAERSNTFCHIYGCFDSSDTQLSATLDGDEIYYADFKKDLLIWDSKLPTNVRPEYAYTYAVLYRSICKTNIGRWKSDKSVIKKKEPPQIIIYPRDEVIAGEDNTLICFINYFFPPSIKITWTKNDVIVSVEDPFIKCLSNPDGTSYVFSNLDFVPEKGDIYSCTVDHEALEEPQTRLWEVETDEISTGPAVFCGLGLSLGVLGVFGGIFFFVKAGHSGAAR